MNKIEKMLALAFNSKQYIEQGEIPVEILHTRDVSMKTNVVGDRIITVKFL